MFATLTLVMVSTYAHTHKNVYIKYIQLIAIIKYNYSFISK